MGYKIAFFVHHPLTRQKPYTGSLQTSCLGKDATNQLKNTHKQNKKNGIVPARVKKRHFYIKLIKNIKIEIFLKIGFWGGFGPILNPDSNSARKMLYITWFKSMFYRFLKNLHFRAKYCFENDLELKSISNHHG